MTKKKKNDDVFYDQPGIAARFFSFLWNFVKVVFKSSGRLAKQTGAVAFAFCAASLRLSVRLVKAAWHLSWSAVRGTFNQSLRLVKWTWHGFVGVLRWLTGWGSQSEPVSDYERIRRRVQAHYRRRTWFISHVVVFAFGNAMLWIDWFSRWPYYGGYFLVNGYFLVTVFWSMLLALHFVRFKMGDAQDRAIQREWERERQWQAHMAASYDPAYDEAYMRLSDDGELVEMVMDDQSGKLKRSSRLDQ